MPIPLGNLKEFFLSTKSVLNQILDIIYISDYSVHIETDNAKYSAWAFITFLWRPYSEVNAENTSSSIQKPLFQKLYFCDICVTIS